MDWHASSVVLSQSLFGSLFSLSIEVLCFLGTSNSHLVLGNAICLRRHLGRGSTSQQRRWPQCPCFPFWPCLCFTCLHVERRQWLPLLAEWHLGPSFSWVIAMPRAEEMGFSLSQSLFVVLTFTNGREDIVLIIKAPEKYSWRERHTGYQHLTRLAVSFNTGKVSQKCFKDSSNILSRFWQPELDWPFSSQVLPAPDLPQ